MKQPYLLIFVNVVATIAIFVECVALPRESADGATARTLSRFSAIPDLAVAGILACFNLTVAGLWYYVHTMLRWMRDAPKSERMKYGGWFFYKVPYLTLKTLCLFVHAVLLGDPFAFLLMHLCTLLASRAVLYSLQVWNFLLAIIFLAVDAGFTTGTTRYGSRLCGLMLVFFVMWSGRQIELGQRENFLKKFNIIKQDKEVARAKGNQRKMSRVMMDMVGKKIETHKQMGKSHRRAVTSPLVEAMAISKKIAENLTTMLPSDVNVSLMELMSKLVQVKERGGGHVR